MSTADDKEIAKLRNRLRELSDKSYNNNMFTFTGFLGLSELSVYWQSEKDLSHATLCGGYEDSERQVIRFGNSDELGYEVEFPICCIHIKPLAVRFADKLSHRDFLGALMNLGIERSTLGDIIVGEKEAYLFCLESISEFICENLSKIKHTSVLCEVVNDMKEVPKEKPKVISIQVSSLRIDACISKVYNMSRSDCLELFREKRVFLDGRLCENNSRLIKPEETVNARGFGKFKAVSQPRETRKGKLNLEVEVYR